MGGKEERQEGRNVLRGPYCALSLFGFGYLKETFFGALRGFLAEPLPLKSSCLPCPDTEDGHLDGHPNSSLGCPLPVSC